LTIPLPNEYDHCLDEMSKVVLIQENIVKDLLKISPNNSGLNNSNSGSPLKGSNGYDLQDEENMN